MQRVLIYFIYDRDGIVDDYIFYCIDALRQYVTYLIVVVNGELSEQYYERLKHIVDRVIIRPNIGFDVWAYKEGIESIGWEGLSQYDELVLMNYTIMGPVYDIGDMFNKMNAKTDLDFWGITKCFREDNPEAVKLWGNPYGYIPEHIQSSFMCFRKTLFESEMFHELWDNMPLVQSYHESGGQYEQVITKRFSDAGFQWDCYTDYSSLDPKASGCCPLITDPLTVVGKLKSPFFKRRSFFTSKREFPSVQPFAKLFWDYLENQTEYDVDLALKNFVRTLNQRDIIESLIFCHVFKEELYIPENKISSTRTAIFVAAEDIIDVSRLKRAQQKLGNSFSIFIGDRFCFDLHSLCTGAKASFSSFDYVVWICPPEQGVNEHLSVYRSRQEYYVFSLLENPYLIVSATQMLEQDPGIGMLSFPVDYYSSLNWDEYESWADYYKLIEKWKTRNGLHVAIDIEKPPVSSSGGCSVIRTKAISGIETMCFHLFTPAFLSYALALVCQENGFIPQYFITENLAKNALFGYSGYTSWIPEILAIKREYYIQLKNYNKQTEEYNRRTLEDYRIRTEQAELALNKLSNSLLVRIMRRLKRIPQN